MALIVLDASVLIAQLDPEDALHSRVKAALHELERDDFVLPASALSETLVLPARTGRAAQVRAQIDRLRIRIEPLDGQIAEGAAELRGRHRALRLPDALVVATGNVLDADVILTADRRWTAWSNLVRLI